MPEVGTTSMLEPYVLLANGAKNAAAVGLVQQVLEAPGVYVFGEFFLGQHFFGETFFGEKYFGNKSFAENVFGNKIFA